MGGAQLPRLFSLALLYLEALFRNIESVSELLKSLSLVRVFCGNKNLSFSLPWKQLGVFLWPEMSLLSSLRKKGSSAMLVTEFLMAS